MAATQNCLLALDTATGPCSAAVWKNGRVAAYVENIKPVMQSASLILMIEDALKQSGTGYEELTAVAATIGPGSFTGIRVALAAARAICYARKIPGMGYTTLQVLSFAMQKQSAHKLANTLALLNAGKGEQYFQYYSNKPWAPLHEPQLATLDQALKDTPAGNIAVAGNIVVTDPRFTNTNITFPRADALAELASAHPELAQDSLRPFYIRPPDAKLPVAKINTQRP
jgi:tRNA threonylcarbamoyladenosine biosynthesis protein TsaB